MFRIGKSVQYRLSNLSPYVSLAIVLVPLAIVEPLKILALVIAGEGHWLGGAAALVVAYAVSLCVVERLLRLLKPNLMRLPWIAYLWGRWDLARDNVRRWFQPNKRGL